MLSRGELNVAASYLDYFIHAANILLRPRAWPRSLNSSPLIPQAIVRFQERFPPILEQDRLFQLYGFELGR